MPTTVRTRMATAIQNVPRSRRSAANSCSRSHRTARSRLEWGWKAGGLARTASRTSALNSARHLRSSLVVSLRSSIIPTSTSTSERQILKPKRRSTDKRNALQVSTSEGVLERNLSAERAPYGTSRTQPQDQYTKMIIHLEGAHAFSMGMFGGVEHLRELKA